MTLRRILDTGGLLILSAALLVGTTGCVGACTTIGYLNNADIRIEFDTALLSSDEVAACLGPDCEPVAVNASGEEWLVPQAAPYLDGVLAPGGSTDAVARVVVTDATGDVIHDETHDIPTVLDRTGLFGQCPGPYNYDPVEVAIESRE